MKTTTQETISDYQQANNAAQALFESLGIETIVSRPVADVKDEWPNILYNVTFSKGGRNLTTEYRLGVGHVSWKSFRMGTLMAFCGNSPVRGLTADEESLINAKLRNPSASFKNKALEASAAAKLAYAQKLAPKPYEVLAAICDDGFSAHVESFDGYAGNYGMDTDSIKARRIYDFCGDLYHKVAALIGADNVVKFAEFHAQF